MLSPGEIILLSCIHAQVVSRGKQEDDRGTGRPPRQVTDEF